MTFDNDNFNFDNDSNPDSATNNYYEDTDINNDEEIQKRKNRYWLLIILLFIIGVSGLFGIWYLCHSGKSMKANYEAYIQNTNDSFMIVVADLNNQIDSLEAQRSQLSGIIGKRNRSINYLNRKLRELRKEYDPVKYREALAQVKELRDYVTLLEDQIEGLKAENNLLNDDNKMLKSQVDDWTAKYDELYQNYIACCKDGANLLAPNAGKPISDDDEQLSEDDYTVVAENAALKFQAIDKKGNLIEDTKKIRVSDIKTFLITFDAKSTRSTDHMFYIRVTDSIQGNLVVPSNYAETGKKILKLPDGEELPYTFSLGYKFEKPNVVEKISTGFDPYYKQIRYLPYRVEVYDSRGKHTEGYAIPQVGKKKKKKARWIW